MQGVEYPICSLGLYGFGAVYSSCPHTISRFLRFMAPMDLAIGSREHVMTHCARLCIAALNSGGFVPMHLLIDQSFGSYTRHVAFEYPRHAY